MRVTFALTLRLGTEMATSACEWRSTNALQPKVKPDIFLETQAVKCLKAELLYNVLNLFRPLRLKQKIFFAYSVLFQSRYVQADNDDVTLLLCL